MNEKKPLPLQVECLVLFQSNPLLAMSLEEVAGKLGGKQEDLQPVLELLMRQGIVGQSGDGPAKFFSYKEPVTVAEFEIDLANPARVMKAEE